MTQTTGTVIGTGITLTSITTGYLFLSTVSGGDFIQGITILTTLPAIRTDYDNSYPYDYYNGYPDSYYDPSYPSDYDDQASYSDSQQPVPNATVGTVQSELAQLGYYHGAIDGVVGDETEAALARYQEDHDLSVTGTLTAATLQSLGLPRRPS